MKFLATLIIGLVLIGYGIKYVAPMVVADVEVSVSKHQERLNQY